MTAPVAAVSTVEGALVELLGRGYSLSVETRVQVHNHKVGAHAITYADNLIVTGLKRVPDYLRETIVANKPLFLAAACILNPPTPWLRYLSGRCNRGVVFVSSGENVEYRITPEVLAANIAGFVGLNAVVDRERLEPIVHTALRLTAREMEEIWEAKRVSEPEGIIEDHPMEEEDENER